MGSVWYIGGADSRTITSAEWAQIGVISADTVWDQFNGFSLPRAQFNQDQLNFLNLERRFDIDAPDGPRQDPLPEDTSLDINELREEWQEDDATVLQTAMDYADGAALGGTYVHTQLTPAAEWVANHSLGKKRDPTVFVDPDPTIPVYPDILHASDDIALIVFPEPMTGTAHF